MVKIELIPGEAKVNWRLALFRIVLFLIFSCIVRSQNASPISESLRLSSHPAETALRSALRRRTTWQDRIDLDSPMYKPHKKSRRPLLTFERLEDRLVFSSSELAIPSLGGMTGPGSLDPDSQPPLTPTNAIALDDNWTPLVYAGQDISTTLGNTALLNGEVISNTNQGLSIEWRLVSGPGTATISNGNTANASATFSVAGVYEFELTVSNDFASALPDRVSVAVNAASSSLPALPELFDTTYTLPTGGTTRHVNAGGNFQAALDAAVPGDVIVLEAGATFTGNFSLPKKQGDGWIYIISSKLNQLPANGRVGLGHANLMPKLVAGNVQIPTLRTEFGAHHYRIAGIEVVTNEAKLDLIRTGYGIPEGDRCGTCAGQEPSTSNRITSPSTGC